MNNLNKNYLIKIPNYSYFFYYKSKNFIILKFKEKLKFFNFSSNLFLLIIKNKVFLMINVLTSNSNILTKELNFQLNSLSYNINSYLFEIKNRIYKKFQLIGIGFKIFQFKNFLNKAYLLKLGFSHNIYLKINKTVFSFCVKSIEIYVISNYINKINNICSLIKLFKLPNSYKKKGILFYNEKIKLKKAKKT